MDEGLCLRAWFQSRQAGAGGRTERLWTQPGGKSWPVLDSPQKPGSGPDGW